MRLSLLIDACGQRLEQLFHLLRALPQPVVSIGSLLLVLALFRWLGNNRSAPFRQSP